MALKGVPICKFIKADGNRCGFSAMRDDPDGFCYHHSKTDRAQELQAERGGKRIPGIRTLKQGLTIVEAIRSGRYFGVQFPKGFASWANWLVCLKAIFGLPMTEDEQKIYHEYTGRTDLPTQAFKEVFLIIGARGGKSFISALVAVYLALFKDWSDRLRPGEVGWIFVIATDRDQARIVMSYIGAILAEEPFKSMVVQETKGQITLANNIVIEIHTASFRGVRGYTVLAAVCDELGVWRAEDSANPSQEIIEMLEPRMVEGSLMIGISTPRSRKGVLWDAYKEKYGKNDPDILVWKAGTREMNPTFSQKKIDRALKRNPTTARAEYFAEFRADVEGYLSLEDIEAVTVRRRKALLPCVGVHYKAFVDPTGGKSDSFALSIGHAEKNKIIIDRIEERLAPCDLKAVVKNFCLILRDYGIHQVVGDEFGGRWCAAEFALVDKSNNKYGVKYIPVGRSKSELYLFFQPIVLTGSVELLDIKRLGMQFQSLERAVRADSKDAITHPRGGHDDVANVVARVATILYKNIGIGLTEEYMAARLPTAQGRKYRSREIETEERKIEREVMDELEKEGEL